MVKLRAYKVVTSSMPHDFSGKINNSLEDGWELVGDYKVTVISKREVLYSQAMALYESSEYTKYDRSLEHTQPNLPRLSVTT
jgi:hypothetical protein